MENGITETEFDKSRRDAGFEFAADVSFFCHRVSLFLFRRRFARNKSGQCNFRRDFFICLDAGGRAVDFLEDRKNRRGVFRYIFARRGNFRRSVVFKINVEFAGRICEFYGRETENES